MAFPHRLVMHRPVMCHDPLLGHRYVPSLDVRVPHERGCYFVRTNAQGFRSDRDFERRHGDRRRVLVFGDSFASGDGVSNHERFSDLLAARHQLDVQNYCVSGSGADQHVLMLEDFGLDHAPDLILLCVAVHTIHRVQQSSRVTVDRFGRRVRAARPHFVLEGGSLRLRGVPVPEAVADDSLDSSNPESRQELDSPLLVGARDRIARLFGRGPSRVWCEGRQRFDALARRIAQRTGLRDVDPDYSERQASGWSLLARILLRFHASASGVPVVILPLPTPEYSIDRLEPRFQRKFAELCSGVQGLHVIDVTSPLARRPFSVRRKFAFERDGHLTPEAHAAIADALSCRLVELGLLDEESCGSPTAPCPSRRGADVLRIGWREGDAYARLERNGEGIAIASERSLFEATPCSGALPFAAVSHCLEVGRVVGPELERIVLVSPDRLEVVLERIAAVERTQEQFHAAAAARVLAPWVRWIGAAERDIRRLLHFKGAVEHRCAEALERSFGDASSSLACRPERTLGSDLDGTWLDGEIGRVLRRHRTCAERLFALHRLAGRWERATRRVRHEVLP